MLPKANRLCTLKEFSLTYKQGRKYLNAFFYCYALKRSDQLTSKFGFVASKKVGKAVERNKAKRRFRNIVYGELAKIKNGYNVVFVIFQQANTAPFSELQGQIHATLQKADLYS